MKDFRFGSQDGSKPSYYVFIKASRNIDEHAFFRYDTPKEAIALFEYKRTRRFLRRLRRRQIALKLSGGSTVGLLAFRS